MKFLIRFSWQRVGLYKKEKLIFECSNIKRNTVVKIQLIIGTEIQGGLTWGEEGGGGVHSQKGESPSTLNKSI